MVMSYIIHSESPSDSLVSDVIPVASYMMSRAGFTKERTLANIAELLLGGVDTTSNALLWVIYELSRNQHVSSNNI